MLVFENAHDECSGGFAAVVFVKGKRNGRMGKKKPSENLLGNY